jgi:hypothetical protein
MAATMIAATMVKKKPQLLMPCAVFLNGCPHLGHAAALEEILEPQAGQIYQRHVPPTKIVVRG